MQSLNCAFLLRDATSSQTKHTRNIRSVRFEHLDNVYGEIDFWWGISNIL